MSMKGYMKNGSERIVVLGLFLLALLLGSSCDSTSDTDNWHPIRFELAADKVEGTAPDTVTFTGTLYGDIDALVMGTPDVCFCPHELQRSSLQLMGPQPEICICYYVSDSTQSAKRSYVETYIYEAPGTYKASMRLNCLNGVFSDTIVVFVQ